MIRCPQCQSSRLRVDGGARDSPHTTYYIRRRVCRSCGHKFRTFEYVEPPINDRNIRIALGFLARATSYLKGEKQKGRGKARPKD